MNMLSKFMNNSKNKKLGMKDFLAYIGVVVLSQLAPQIETYFSVPNLSDIICSLLILTAFLKINRDLIILEVSRKAQIFLGIIIPIFIVISIFIVGYN